MNIFKRFIAVLASHETNQPGVYGHGNESPGGPDRTAAAEKFAEEARREKELSKYREKQQQERMRTKEIDVPLEELEKNPVTSAEDTDEKKPDGQ